MNEIYELKKLREKLENLGKMLSEEDIMDFFNEVINSNDDVKYNTIELFINLSRSLYNLADLIEKGDNIQKISVSKELN